MQIVIDIPNTVCERILEGTFCGIINNTIYEAIRNSKPLTKVFEDIKSQISLCKKNIKSENSDYLTGYICAFSTVEGMIAEADGG